MAKEVAFFNDFDIINISDFWSVLKDSILSKENEMNYISEIKALAKKGRRRDPECWIFGADHHRWSFGKPVTMREIRAFEDDMQITLPEPLVRYLTKLGNGGAGPEYGIYDLDTMRKKSLHLPKTADLPVMLDHSLTAEQWMDFAQKYDELGKEPYDTKEREEEIMQEAEKMEMSLLAGGLYISTPGCTMNSVLMCRGAAAGEVFVIDFDFVDQLQSEPYCCGKFEDWMIEGMKKSLSGENGINSNAINCGINKNDINWD